ncbi:MAG: type III-B CRISPR module-associated protein Cmr5 [Armatimonadetes bacterium]|nr:type III-B CRISPR module-associated protein Cmr5 [Armatimonadota bacterium]
MKTRAQQDMELALKLVQQVAEKYPNQDDKPRKIYGGLCHSFPVLVRTCGLCQALAFLEDKATTEKSEDERADAHRLLLDHIAKIMSKEDRGSLMATVRGGSALDYLHYTRRILSVWIYFKRFAVSILKVKNAQEAQSDAGET